MMLAHAVAAYSTRTVVATVPLIVQAQCLYDSAVASDTGVYAVARDARRAIKQRVDDQLNAQFDCNKYIARFSATNRPRGLLWSVKGRSTVSGIAGSALMHNCRYGRLDIDVRAFGHRKYRVMLVVSHSIAGNGRAMHTTENTGLLLRGAHYGLGELELAALLTLAALQRCDLLKNAARPYRLSPEAERIVEYVDPTALP